LANPTQEQREWFCFWCTLPSIVLPILAIVIVALIIGYLFPQVINFVVQLWMLAERGVSSFSDEDDDDEDKDASQADNQPMSQSQIQDWYAKNQNQ
jgi:hypothetical protein